MVDRYHPGKAPSALLQALANGACRTIDQLAEDLDLTRRQISDAASCLMRRDYLLRMGTGCYQLSDDGLSAAAKGEVITSGPHNPRNAPQIVRNTLRQRAWRSMRMRRRFTVLDLVADAATPDDTLPENNLRRYLRELRKAGYVSTGPRRVGGTALTSNGHKLWVLSRDTGPRAPVFRSAIAAIHDPNLGEDVPCIRS